MPAGTDAAGQPAADAPVDTDGHRPRRGRLALPVGIGAAAVVAVVVAATALRPTTEPGTDVAAVSAGAPTARLCGVADPDRYAALSAADADAPSVVRTLARDVSTPDGATPEQLAPAGDDVLALTVTDEGATVVRYGPDGRVAGELTVPPADDGSVPRTLVGLDDGTVLLPVPQDGSPAVVAYDAGGDPTWTADLDLDRGAVAAIVGWSAGRSDAVAAVTFTGSDQVALLAADGTVDPDGPRVEPGLPFAPGDGTLVVRTEPEPGDVVLERYDADGDPAGSFGGVAEGTTPNGGPAFVERPTGVVTSPDGGLLVWGPRYRLVETSADGVWRGVTLSGKGSGPGAVVIGDLSPLVRVGDRYVFLSPTEDGTALAEVDLDGMRAVLAAPMTWDLATADVADRLGYGAGLTTDAAYGYVAPGGTPEVSATFEPWWGQVADAYELRYEVSGDPTVADPVTPVSATAALPADGGDVALELPPARPGAYEVHAELVERATGEVRSATCLRYAVGGPGATFDPDGLSDGADWGGAGPLRGVELADQLGIGTHRVQLDFARLVPDVDAEPSVAALDLAALPGATEADPFADLAAAAELARETGVQLYVQLGQGGEAERAAVDSGRWGGWVTAIAQALRQGAPDLHVWAPWNEPNNTGFPDGGAYATQVLAPFAQAVRGVDPQAVVVGGNALNVIVPWYEQLLAAGGCASLDVVGIHPYTGFNRSWDEEGEAGPLGQIPALRAAVDAACGPGMPMWDTESGWWSDGPANHWAQAHDVARSLLWMRHLGVDEWLYFYSEGGWGEGGFSWSLLQYESFVEPAALAMSTTSRLLEGRAAPRVVETDLPFTHVLRADAGTGTSDDLVAVWTQDLATTVGLTAAADVVATLTDVYGHERELALTAGEPAVVDVSGAPLFVTVPAGTAVEVVADEPFGPELLGGGTVTASSTSGETPASALVEPGGARGAPWFAGQRTEDGPDVSPWVRVDLPGPTRIDRVAVESAGIRCCTSGVRAYTVEVLDGEEWVEVARVDGLFHERTSVARFEPVTTTAVRVRIPSTTTRGVTVPDVNHSGQTGGLMPAWEPLRTEPSWPVGLVTIAAWGPA